MHCKSRVLESAQKLQHSLQPSRTTTLTPPSACIYCWTQSSLSSSRSFLRVLFLFQLNLLAMMRGEQETPLGTLKGYLKASLSSEVFAALKNQGEGVSLRDFVDANFDVMDEGILRGLIAAALRNQDDSVKREVKSAAELLGTWGVVIDVVREVTGERQQRAGRNFQAVMAIAKQGEPKVVAAALTKLFREQQIDHLFLDLLDSTQEECRKAGHDEFVGMLGFFKEVLDKNRIVAVSLAARAAAANTANASSPNTASAKVAVAIPPPAPSAGSTSAIAMRTTKSKEAFPPGVPPTSRVEELDSDDEGEDAEDDDDDDDAVDDDDDNDKNVEVPEVGSARGPSSLSNEAHDQESLMQAGEYLTYLLETYKGDASALRDRAQSDLCSLSPPKLPFGPAALRQVVSDHLQAASQAGYVNRVQFMKFMLTRVLQPVEEMLARRGDAAGEGAAVGGSAETTYHAPKFVDGVRSEVCEAAQVLAPSAFIDASSLSAPPTSGRGTSKSQKKEKKRATAAVAKKVGAHLQEHGWAVCDRFQSADVVRRVRIEAGLFADHYEQSEVWVGARADVGTLLSVPSVRGDKVIWMCGGHKAGAPEGVTRIIKTAGEIEPCRLEAKARAPMRKFGALKELVASCDRLMDELKLVVPDVSGVYDRSDAMLANYPGEGSRFARHVDNTTQDGRRVTMLVYLNPGWTTDKGGALRLTPPNTSTAVDVFPECGRLAIFNSAIMPHEVMPTWGDRHAITIWYYDAAERAESLRRAKDSGRAESAAKAGADAQREAKHFIGDLMGGDDIDTLGGEPSPEELTALANKVQDLSPEALGIVASITGAPSTQSFKDGFRLLVPEDLKQMRMLFRRMGLND